MHEYTQDRHYDTSNFDGLLQSVTLIFRMKENGLVHTVRKIWWLIEQPQSSMLPYFRDVRAVMAMAGNVVPAFDCLYYMGCLGHWCPIPSLSSGSACWLPVLQLRGNRRNMTNTPRGP